MMNVMKEQPRLLLFFIKIAEKLLFQFFLSYVIYPARLRAIDNFDKWQKQLKTSQADILKLHKSFGENVKNLHHWTQKLLDKSMWNEKQHKDLAQVIEQINFSILKAVQTPEDREDSEKTILNTVINKLTDFQKTSLLHYLMITNEDKERCREFLLKLLRRLVTWAKQKKKPEVLLSCAETFTRMAGEIREGYGEYFNTVVKQHESYRWFITTLAEPHLP